MLLTRRQRAANGRELWVVVEVLGPIQLRRGTEVMAPTPRMARLLLGTLALRANRTVTAETLRLVLWSGRPPASAAANLRSYLAELRRLFGAGTGKGLTVAAGRAGYRLHAQDGAVDATQFGALASEGRTLLQIRDYQGAGDRLTRALDMWQGSVFAGDPVPEPLQPEVTALEMRRQDTLEDLIEVRLALGEHRELCPELVVLTHHLPLRERIGSQLMLALYRSGRQGESLAAYRLLRKRLGDELGVSPTPQTEQLHHQILQADPSL